MSGENSPEWQHRSLQQHRENQEIIAKFSDEVRQIDEIALVHGWFGAGNGGSFFSIIQEYLAGKTQLDNAIAKTIQCVQRAGQASEKADSELPSPDFWYSIIHSSRRVSYHNVDGHSKLVSLVKASKEHKVPSEEDPNTQVTLYNDTDWRLALREAYNDAPQPCATNPAIKAWTNFNYFLARLANNDVTDIWIFAIWALRSALEQDHKDDKTKEDGPRETATQKYDASVPAAAVWMLGAGRKLYEKEEDLTPKNPRSGNPGRGGELWKGKAEFGKERWAFWKKRFGEVTAMDGLRGETKDIAKQAVDAMDQAEHHD